jgi:hypothetical protein
MQVRELGHARPSLALRAPSIQRKSIHSLPTGALLAATLLTAAGCAGGRAGTTPAGDRVLVPASATVQITPHTVGSARFVLTSGRVPIAGQVVTFSIPDLPQIEGDEANGSMLLQTSAVTDIDGVAAVDVAVEDPTVFHVSATVEGAKDSDLAVIVAVEAGSVEVAPFFPPGSSAASLAASIDVRLFDGKPCASINLANPGSTSRLTVNVIPPDGTTTQFDIVSTAETNAVVAGARDGHGIAVAVGCADLLGSSLVPKGVVQLLLRLDDTAASPIGRFAVTSALTFTPPLAAAPAIAAAWSDLTDCPLDPAQLLLDCMIDALSPTTAADPLDCKPNLAPGGEGPIGDALMLRRGVPIVDAAGTVTSCRGARDAANAPSLDGIVLGLFGTPTPPLIVALPAIGHDAAHMIDSVQLGSTLTVQSSGSPDQYIVTHTLDSAYFPSSLTTEMVNVPLVPLALPALTAYTTAFTKDGQLVVNAHGFSLRLGTIARAGFGAAALQPRLPPQTPPDIGGLLTEILRLASVDDGNGGTLTSCAAFDALLCQTAGAERTCLASACSGGLLALKARLEGVFGAADGTGRDLTLAGSAPLLDIHGAGFAHQLGTTSLDDNAARANWQVDLRTASGRAQMVTSFVGVRE